ncbi:AAA family ATPase [Roseibacterium sp. SDUM158017]|uniref:AAA family ATPase n=1 Tax=Roseicyclus salinarum TaxID=3036773 RepID=UPI0024154BF3|nr:AAA family ATPase [Roseibacterium sp. SDUM158017]MDG4647346.1 AAA family ATPase [Roseibacterium sp. SDUM158017]
MTMTAKSDATIPQAPRPGAATARPRNVAPVAEGAPAALPAAIDDAQIEMARAKGVRVVRAARLDEAEIASIREMREKMGPGHPLVAITGAATSLADVRRLTRAGITEVVPDTIAPEEFADLIAEITRRGTSAEGTRQPGRVIAVTRARGGVGATTVAVNLADALLDRRGRFRKTSGKTVALVDLDLQLGDVASFLDVDPSDALYELAVTGKTPDETYLRQAMTTLPTGLSVLTAPARFAPMDALKAPQVARIIDILRSTHDYVVLDLPSGLSEWMDPIIEQADQALMVTDCAVPSIRQARRLMDFFAEANPGLNIEIVVNHETKPLLLRRHQAAAEKVLERRFRHWVPDDPAAAREALDRGAPLSQTSPRSRLRRAVSRLARDLATALQDTRTNGRHAAH